METAVVVALITAVPTSVAAVASVVGARRTKNAHNEMRTNHGLRAGDYIEQTSAAVSHLAAELAAHTAQDQANFERLARQIEEK